MTDTVIWLTHLVQIGMCAPKNILIGLPVQMKTDRI